MTRGDGGLFASLYCSQAGYLGVALFFFLSGYGLTKSNQRHQMTFGEFINKRVLKIVLPMILANLLWAVFCFVAIDKLDLFGLSQKLDVNNVTLGGVICSLMALCSNTGAYFDGTLWFIKVLLLLYVALYISACFKNKATKMIVLGVLIVGVTLFVSFFMRTWMAVSVPLFMIGVCVADCPEFFRKHFWVFVFSFVAACVIFVLIFKQALVIHAIINYLVVLAIIIIAYFANVKFVGVSALVGVFSFDIYLTHNKARMLTFALFDHPAYWIYLLIMIAFSIIFHYVKKVILPKY